MLAALAVHQVRGSTHLGEGGCGIASPKSRSFRAPDPRIAARTDRPIDEIKRRPFTGIGKPEPRRRLPPARHGSGYPPARSVLHHVVRTAQQAAHLGDAAPVGTHRAAPAALPPGVRTRTAVSVRAAGTDQCHRRFRHLLDSPPRAVYTSNIAVMTSADAAPYPSKRSGRHPGLPCRADGRRHDDREDDTWHRFLGGRVSWSSGC
jgi:hypothetical protein